jgi:double-stranded uracil-DNA glycosylase
MGGPGGDVCGGRHGQHAAAPRLRVYPSGSVRALGALPSGAVSTPWRPTKEQLAAARGAVVPDVIAPDLDVLFCGINPGLYSGAVGHHFARPGNRFWKSLHAAGFTDRVLSPFDEAELLDVGLGITNLVERATATADELHRDELKRGARRLRRKAARFRPRWVAFLGLTAYRVAFGQTSASVGPQEQTLSPARVWLLPNPSGLNAHYQVPDLARVFGELRDEVQSNVGFYAIELGVGDERREHRRRPRRVRR